MSHGLFDLSGEVAVVIGATGVLGGALAEGLANAGADVAVLGRNADRGEACAARIVGQGGRARFFAADAVDGSSLRAAHEAIQSSFGAPTVLVNAAGGNDPKVTVTAEHAFEKIAIQPALVCHYRLRPGASHYPHRIDTEARVKRVQHCKRHFPITALVVRVGAHRDAQALGHLSLRQSERIPHCCQSLADCSVLFAG